MKRQDLTNKRFTRLFVLELSNKKWKNGARLWRCVCDCGNEVYTTTSALNSGHTKSCGCYSFEKRIKTSTTHNMCGTSEHNIYRGMKQRCMNPKNKVFKYYGGRGIYICRRWRRDFLNFYKDMGKRPSKKHSIDRIDNNGPYVPWNCRWATAKQQNVNTSANTLIQYNGEIKTLSEWSEVLEINASTLCYRFLKDMDVQEAFETPIKKKMYYDYYNEKLTLTEISRRIGMNSKTLMQRIAYGWTLEDAINTPINEKSNWRISAGIKHNKSILKQQAT